MITPQINTIEQLKKYFEREKDLIEYELIHGAKIDNMENYAELRGAYKIIEKFQKDIFDITEVSLI
jgi:hypothetical protein